MIEAEVRAYTLMTIISGAYAYLISCESIMTDLDGLGEGKAGVIDSTRGLQHVLEERLKELSERLQRLDERMMDFKRAIDD